MYKKVVCVTVFICSKYAEVYDLPFVRIMSMCDHCVLIKETRLMNVKCFMSILHLRTGTGECLHVFSPFCVSSTLHIMHTPLINFQSFNITIIIYIHIYFFKLLFNVCNNVHLINNFSKSILLQSFKKQKMADNIAALNDAPVWSVHCLIHCRLLGYLLCELLTCYLNYLILTRLSSSLNIYNVIHLNILYYDTQMFWRALGVFHRYFLANHLVVFKVICFPFLFLFVNDEILLLYYMELNYCNDVV